MRLLFSALTGLALASCRSSSPTPEPPPFRPTSSVTLASPAHSASAGALATPPPTASASASAVASASAAPVAPVDSVPVRPCEVRLTSVVHRDNNECVELRRVAPEGLPLLACFRDGPPLRFRYDTQGRIVSSPEARYEHSGATSTRIGGKTRTSMRFDLKTGQVLSNQGATYSYDPRGRLSRVDSGGRFLKYTYAPDGTYKTSHNYPDRDEFCEADLVELRRDARGRVAVDRFDNCGINETPHTLTYRYDASDRIEAIDVDFSSDGSVDGVVQLRFTCDLAPRPHPDHAVERGRGIPSNTGANPLFSRRAGRLPIPRGQLSPGRRSAP